MNEKLEHEITIKEWSESNKELTKDMAEWRKHYSCRQKCDEWQKWKFCKHLVKARAGYFRERIEEQISNLYFMNYGVTLERFAFDKRKRRGEECLN